LTEVKFRNDAAGQQRALEKLVRNIARRFTRPADAISALNLARQLHFDVALDTDITLTGPGMARQGQGRTFSEVEGQIHVRWELWSRRRDEIVIPVSGIKRILDPQARGQEQERIRELIMRHVIER